MIESQPILIVGLPRSGTTWIGEVLASAPGASYLFEPDNEGLSPVAWFAKRNLHRFPYLTAADEAPALAELWTAIMAGPKWIWPVNNALGQYFRRKAFELEASIGEKCGLTYIDPAIHRVGPPGIRRPYLVDFHKGSALVAERLLSARSPLQPGSPLVIKSVHASLCAAWIAARFPARVVFVLRNPFSLYASYRRMKLPDGYRNLLLQVPLQRDRAQYLPGAKLTLAPERVDHLMFQMVLMYKIIERQLSGNPDWTVVSHDRLCIAPQEGYERLFRRLTLAWRGATGRKIDSLAGVGTGFDPRRVSSQEPSKWKSELTTRERQRIEFWIDAFDLRDFFHREVNLE